MKKAIVIFLLSIVGCKRAKNYCSYHVPEPYAVAYHEGEHKYFICEKNNAGYWEFYHSSGWLKEQVNFYPITSGVPTTFSDSCDAKLALYEYLSPSTDGNNFLKTMK